jgi:hypothetical protein
LGTYWINECRLNEAHDTQPLVPAARFDELETGIEKF